MQEPTSPNLSKVVRSGTLKETAFLLTGTRASWDGLAKMMGHSVEEVAKKRYNRI